MELTNLRDKLLQNPKFREAYFEHDLAYETAKMLIKARIKKGVTQEKLAEMMKTKQAGISRAENGASLPSLSFIAKMAKAYGTYVIPPRFGFLEEEKVNYTYEAATTHVVNHEAPLIRVASNWLNINSKNEGYMESGLFAFAR